MLNSPPRFEIRHHPEDNNADELITNAEETSQVSLADLAEAVQALQIQDYLRHALVIDTFRAAQTQALAEEAGRLSFGNFEGNYHAACWSPGAYAPSIEGRELTYLSRPSSVSSTSSDGVALGNLVNSDVQDAASKGSFARDEHNEHPSAAWNLPPTMLPFPSANVVPFPSAVMPSPFALSPLPPSSRAEEPVVFSSEEEARILEHNLGCLL